MSKLSLKVMLNKQKTKVLFAEADSDFVDVLLSFLTLPLGTIVRLLRRHYAGQAPAIGSLTTLYNGLADLDNANFCTEGSKPMLLSPKRPRNVGKLKLEIDGAGRETHYFACEDKNCDCTKKDNISIHYGVARCDCGKRLTRRVPTRNVSGTDGDCGGGFTMTGSTFIISDELLIYGSGSAIQIISKLGITDTDWGETENVNFGFNEIMDLLKLSFHSSTPLTDVIINKGQTNFGPPSDRLGSPKVEKSAISNSRKTVLKVVVQKSTNKLLFAQAEEDFVDFLFSLLTIPLGKVVSLSDGKTFVTSIDHLYGSVVDHIDTRYFEWGAKTRLTEPKLAHGYLPVKMIIPLEEEEHGSKVYYYPKEDCMSPSHNMEGQCLKVVRFKGHGSYVKGPRAYMVNDDLRVTPLSMTSYISNLNALNVSLSDVIEVEMHVGLDEALSILKASLVSASALSTGLEHFLMKQPKLED